MRKHIILFFSALLFLCACNDDKDAKGVLGRQDMIGVLVDIHLVDGALSNQSNSDSLYRSMGHYMYVFKKHHTDSAQFRKSILYYTKRPDNFMNMYDDVIKILQVKSDSMNSIMAKENEAKRKRAEAEQLKLEKARRDSSAKKGVKPAPDGLKTTRPQNKPQPNAVIIPGAKLHSFKRGI